MDSPDFRCLFEQSPGSFLVLSRTLDIIAVSDRYLRATMTERDNILGRHLFDVFPDNPADPRADGVNNLKASLERVLANAQSDRMPVQRYDVRRPEAEGNAFEERYWSPMNVPVVDDRRTVRWIVHSVEDVTDLVRLEQQGRNHGEAIEELRVRSELRYAQLLDAAPDAMVVVRDNERIDFVNSRAEQLFGYLRTELIGRPLEILVPEAFRERHRCHFARFLKTPEEVPIKLEIEQFARHKSGEPIAVEISLRPLRDEGGLSVLASVRDIRDRKRAEMELRLGSERLSSAIESMQDAFALFDGQRRLLVCNAMYRELMAACDVCPATDADWRGLAYARIVAALGAQLELPDEDRAAFVALFVQRDDAHPRAADVRTHSGRSLRLMSRVTPEGGIVDVIWDVTDDERRAEALRAARAEAEAASAAKSDFLSSMSHELRTPLNAILGFAQLLQRDKQGTLSPRNRERVGHILRGGEHLLRLVDDALDFARIEAGRISVGSERVDILAVLTETLEALSSDARLRGVTLELKCAARRAPSLAVDRVRIAQVLLNLGSNAIKYNRSGGKATFEVCAPEAGCLRICVHDTGIGIPLEYQNKLFQPFQRAGQELGPIEGTGIGLTISKRLVELMGGQIGFHSMPGEGASFWIEFPLHEGVGGTAESESSNEAAKEVPDDALGVRTVLYVEDSSTNVALMRELLRSFEGTTLITRSNGEDGVLAAAVMLPDVILMDINLPRMSGFDALSALRANEATRHIPVIALSAAASARDVATGLRAGFFRYLTKPIRFDDLAEALTAASGARSR